MTPGPRRERLERIGGKDALIIDWLDDTPLDAVPLGQVAASSPSSVSAAAILRR